MLPSPLTADSQTSREKPPPSPPRPNSVAAAPKETAAPTAQRAPHTLSPALSHTVRLYKPRFPSILRFFIHLHILFLSTIPMKFSTVAIALTAASAVSAANQTGGGKNDSGNQTSSSVGGMAAANAMGAGVIAAAAAGVALLI
ncbi:hypothetical protein CJJ09_003739 [Candidozyma auris]|nr:hypothetical protein CJJ09_003739 [[Candida] auris]